VAAVNGTAGNDTLTGTSGNDTINGLGGNDLVLAGSTGGTDVINGGSSFGTINFTGIERVVGGSFNDRLTGNAAGQNLTGAAGADTLAGAGGIDTLWGGTGTDTFVFRETGTANADRIGDWASGSDKLLLDASVMSALGAGGNFAAGDARFWFSASGTAHDADDRIIFNTTTRQVFYDADGSGSGGFINERFQAAARARAGHGDRAL
jgi:serralysin